MIAADSAKARRERIAALQIPKSKEAVITSEDGSLFPQVFYRANTAACSLPEPRGASDTEWMRLPMFENGVAAGPIIDCAPSAVLSGSCDLEGKLNDLEVVSALRTGDAFQFFLPRVDPDMDKAVVVTRARFSCSTGVVFLDEKHLAVASYGMKRIYLYRYALATSEKKGLSFASLLDSVNTTGNPDLMDVDLERGMLVVSQLKQGTQQLFRYDVERGSLEAFKEVSACVEIKH